MRFSDNSIRGRTVIAGDGQVLGEIIAVHFDSEGWRVEAIGLKLRKDVADQLGAHRSVFQAGELELPVGTIQSVGETVILSVAMPELQSLIPSDGADAAASS